MNIALKDLPYSVLVHRDPEVISFMWTLAIKTVTEGNAKEHWHVRHNRASTQRLGTRRAFAGARIPMLPVVVTFARKSPNVMDDDNLPGALKHVRDEIAAMYGVGDSPRDPIVWRYEQEKCKRGVYGVRVTICAADAAGGGK